MKTFYLCTSLVLAVPLFIAGCSKPSPEDQKKIEAAFASALASSMTPPSASPGPTQPAAAAAGTGAIGSTCNNKGDGKCTEVMGAEGLEADESCKKLGGIYTKGPTPCPREGLIGTCARSDKESSLNDLDYYYKQEGNDAASLKTLCETVMSGTWAAAPAAAGKAPPAKAAGKK